MPNVQDEPRPWLARAVLLGARIVTAMVVGSGDLLGLFFITTTLHSLEASGNELSMKHQSFLVVRYKNRVLIPTQSQMENGAYLTTDPVAVHDISEEPEIVGRIVEAIQRGNPVVPHPSRDAWPTSVLVPASGAKSQKALEESSATWAAGYDGKHWNIYPSKRNAKGRWEADMTNVKAFPAKIPAADLAHCLLELIKDADVGPLL